MIDPRRSLRARMGIAFGGLALVVSILLGLLAGWLASNALEREAGRALTELADRMAVTMDRDLFERSNEIRTLATREGLIGDQAPAMQQRAELESMQARNRHYTWIGVADPNGIVRAATGGLLEGADVSERPWFRQSLGGQPFVGNVRDAALLAPLLPANEDGSTWRFVDVTAPLFDPDGRFSGVLGAYLSWHWAREIERTLLKPLQQLREAEVFVVGADRRALLAPANLVSLLMPQVLNDATDQPGYRVIRWDDDKDYVTAHARSAGIGDVSNPGWMVVVRQPLDVANAYATSMRYTLWLIGLVAGLLCMTLGWAVADRLARPMRNIALAADRLAEGERDVVLPRLDGRDEIAQLSQSIGRLVKQLTEDERALLALNQQLETRVAERTADLEARNRELESFSYSVSHDLRAPLRAINGYANILREDHAALLDEHGQRLLRQICDGANTMSDLIDELLNLSFARIQPVDFQPVNMMALVQECVTQLCDAGPARPECFHVAALPVVDGDGALLRQVWLNLLGNAVKFSGSRAAPSVHVRCVREGDEWVFEMEDNGEGFPPEQAHRLFEPFTRLHGRKDHPGCGIGLSIVRRIVERHGGRVTATSTPGQGAVFSFALPCGNHPC
ncbi:MAG: ATP-binding protein [Pseudomonadota bacterium]